jgi:hypothetical protein
MPEAITESLIDNLSQLRASPGWPIFVRNRFGISLRDDPRYAKFLKRVGFPEP